MHLASILVLAALAGTGDQPTEPEKGKSVAACDLSGSYRFRFLSNGHDGWWFRFTLAGTPPKAMLMEDVEVLALKAGRLTVAPDPARCGFTLSEKGRVVGKLVIAVDLDAKANTITGKLTRSKATDEAEKSLTINGVRDLGGAGAAAACIVPGIYKVELAPNVRWRNANKDDKRSCKHALEDLGALFLRVEPFGKTLAIGRREKEPPYKETSATETVTLLDDCNVTAKVVDAELAFEARLTFAGDEVTGTALEVNQQVIEDDANLWNCVAKKVPLKLNRIPSAGD